MEVVLDTNFIVTCVKERIDFFSKVNELTSEYVEFILPEEVLQEITNISERKGEKFEDQNSAKISLEMLKLIGPKKVSLNVTNGNVDQGIINFVKDKDCIVATLDKDLKNKVNAKILTIKDKKSLQIID